MKKNNKEFRWGIIGTGGIANAFVKDLEYLDGHRVSSVLSRSMITANNFTSGLKSCNSYDNINSFLDSNYIDAVYIATPNTLHAPQAIMALESGIPVLCEKPFAMNLEEVKSMVKKIHNAGAEAALYMIHAYVEPHEKTNPQMIIDIKDMYINTPTYPLTLYWLQLI